MRKLIGVLALLGAGAAGCAHGQMPPSPPIFQCPTPVYASGQTPNYTVLNPTGTTGNSYIDNHGAGVWCYIAQSFNPATGQNSAPSNVVQQTVASGGTAPLSWTGGSGPSFLISRAAATQAPSLTAPALGQAATAKLEKDDRAPKLIARLTAAQ